MKAPTYTIENNKKRHSPRLGRGRIRFLQEHTHMGDREDVKIWARKNGIREL